MAAVNNTTLFVDAASAAGANINWHLVDGVALRFGKFGDGLSGGDWQVLAKYLARRIVTD